VTFVVVGASLAGLRAVEAARKAGYTGRLVLVGAEPHLPYDRPPLSKAFLDPGEPPPVPHHRTQDELGRFVRQAADRVRHGKPGSAGDAAVARTRSVQGGNGHGTPRERASREAPPTSVN